MEQQQGAHGVAMAAGMDGQVPEQQQSQAAQSSQLPVRQLASNQHQNHHHHYQQQQHPQGLPALHKRPPQPTVNSLQQGLQLQHVPALLGQHPPQAPVPQQVDPYDQYQEDLPAGLLSLGQLLACSLWCVPRSRPLQPERENRWFPFYPTAVIHRPDYFRSDMHKYWAHIAGQQQRIFRAPAFDDEQSYTFMPTSVDEVAVFPTPVIATLHAILKSLARFDRYLPSMSTLALSHQPAATDNTVPGVLAAAVVAKEEAFLQSKAVLAEAEAFSQPENGPWTLASGDPACCAAAMAADMAAAAAAAAAAVAAAPPAVAAAAHTVSRSHAAGSATSIAARSSSWCTAGFVLRQKMRDRHNNLCSTVPAIPGLQTLSSYLTVHPYLQTQQQDWQWGDEEHHLLQPEQQQQDQQSSHLTYVQLELAEDKPILVVEVKKAEKLLDVTGHPLRLAELYTSQDQHVRSLFGQVYSHMMLHQVRIAVLTCHEVLWVMERHKTEVGNVYLSDAIPATNKGLGEVTQLLAMAWAQHKALLQLHETLPTGPELQSGDGSGTDSDSNRSDTPHSLGERSSRPRKQPRHDDSMYGSQNSSQPSADSGMHSGQMLSKLQQSQQPYIGLKQQQQSCHNPLQQQQQQQQQKDRVTLQQQQQLWALTKLEASMPVVPASALGLHQGAEVLDQGGTAVVHRGSIRGQDAAIKVMSWQVRATLREAAMYNCARQLQGDVIPQMLAVGKLSPEYKGLSFIAMSLVTGEPLSSLNITPNVYTAAVSAVQRLHSCGVLHGDLILDNMLLLQQQGSKSSSGSAGTQQQSRVRVMLVDLASARLAGPPECSLEIQRLQCELAARAATNTRASCGQ